MAGNSFEINTALQIQKPVHVVFEAIVNPEQMIHYFISESSGPMEQNKKVIWKFPEFAEEAPVNVKTIELNRYISFNWDIEGRQHLVEITLTGKENDSTLVQIIETGGENNEQGIILWLKQNTEGWAKARKMILRWFR
jgi:uncharacterized protein YndB with AHSA1/START domain